MAHMSVHCGLASTFSLSFRVSLKTWPLCPFSLHYKGEWVGKGLGIGNGIQWEESNGMRLVISELAKMRELSFWHTLKSGTELAHSMNFKSI